MGEVLGKNGVWINQNTLYSILNELEDHFIKKINKGSILNIILVFYVSEI